MKAFFCGLLICVACLAFGSSHGAAQKPFAIVISTDSPVVKAGSDIWIKIKMTNTSDHDVDCSSADVNGLDRRYRYDVRDLSGNSKAKTGQHPEMVPGSIIMCTLKQGESTPARDSRISWLNDISRPGKYVVQVSRGASDNQKDGVVKSNAITISVEP